MQELVIEAGQAERHYWRDLWRYRELFYFLAWRDLLIRYKQTVVGVGWALIRPLLTVAIMTVVFGKAAKFPSGGVPYALMVFCGMLPWQFFSTSLSESGNSLVTNSNLISKVYFPRLIVPASSVITSFVDFMISAAFFALLLVYYHFVPSHNFWAFPLFTALAFAASLGAGLWIAALMVQYRDFRIIVPFVVTFGFYISPVPMMSTNFHSHWILYNMNPMVGVIDGFRWCLLGGEHVLDMTSLVMSLTGTLLLLVTGVWYFRRTERSFADVI